MDELDIDFYIDQLLASIKGLPEPTRDHPRYCDTVGLDVINLDERRLIAIKRIQKEFATFKSDSKKPVCKYDLLKRRVSPVTIDYYLNTINSVMVSIGAVTEARKTVFLDNLLEISHNLTQPLNPGKPMIDQLQEFGSIWKNLGLNTLADQGAVKLIKEKLINARS